MLEPRPGPPYAASMSPLLKLALDLGPLILFFAANSAFGIFTATAVFMAAVLAALAVGFAIERKLSPVPLFTAVLVLVFGGLTLWLNNEFFIKVKPTILYVMFASVLVGGLVSGRIFIKTLLGQSFQLPHRAWRTLTWRWAGFFLALAVLNEGVWRSVSTDDWVAFKVWIVFPLTLVFAFSQTPYILRHQENSQETPPA